MPNKTPSLIKKLDIIFSKYVRLRDALVTTGTKERALCVTCQKELQIARMHAGHWRSRGHKSTRFEETNVHAQCVGCNTFHNGMEEEHRRFIEKSHGTHEVNRLYEESNKPKQWKEEELNDLIDYYKVLYKDTLENN